MHILYKLVFASGKAYIGQTARNMNTRIAQHKRSVKSNSQLPVHCAWRKYGEPEITVVAEFETQDELHAAEKAAIIAIGTLAPQGYNVAYGGESAPSKNPEVAAKIAAKATGRKFLDTTAWSDAISKLWQDDEYRLKVSEGLKASWNEQRKIDTSNRIKAMWEKRKQENWTASKETRKKFSERTFSDETRAKMSDSAKARKRTLFEDSTKQKIASKTASSWQNPAIREKRLASMQLAREKRKQEKTPCH
jgi:hypothetical protein